MSGSSGAWTTVAHWSYRNSKQHATHGDGYAGTHSPLWYSANAGVTWAQVPLPQDGGGYGGSPASDPMFAVQGFLEWTRPPTAAGHC